MSDELVREYERIIDSGYRTLPIFAMPLPDAAYGVLAAFDGHILTERMVRKDAGTDSLTIAQVQLFKVIGEGFSWAMRWLLQGNYCVDVRPAADEKVVADAGTLIQYGSKYHRASMLYSGYSQGRMDVEVEPEKRLARFSHRLSTVATSPTWAFAEEMTNQEARKTPKWNRQFDQLQFGAAIVFQQVPHSLVDGRIVLHGVGQLRDDRVVRYVDWATSYRRLFQPHIDLQGFTVREFNAYWRALYTWSMCTTHLYNWYCDRSALRQERFMPTQVVPLDQFLDSITTLSGLPQDVAGRITDRLTADNRTKKLDMYLQPLLRGEKLVAWSVRAVQLSIPQRNLLKLMARTPAHKSIADQIIGDREKPLLIEMQRWLEAKGWSTAINHKLLATEDAEVDLLGWNWRFPTEIFVVEAKALLQADEPNEIRSATQQMQHAQEQVERLTRLLREMPPALLKPQFLFVEWDKVTQWYGAVITPEGEPGLSFDHSSIPACSFETLRLRLSADQWRSPSSLWTAMVNRQWQAEIRAGQVEYDSMELAGITFEEPVIIY
jgi:hypothetical protein